MLTSCRLRSVRLRCAGLLLLLLAVLAGCSSTRPRLADGPAAPRLQGAQVMLMPVDVALHELLATGLAEPRADWTAQATDLLQQGLRARLQGAGAALLQIESVESARQVMLLQQAVARSILEAELAPERLPTKRDRFDWTLGSEAAAVLRGLAPSGVEPPRYALFCFVRDSYASSGRKALMVVGPLLGLGVQGGRQIGVATLVDLRDGRVSWFNLLLAQQGDLREPAAAQAVVDRLLQGLP